LSWSVLPAPAKALCCAALTGWRRLRAADLTVDGLTVNDRKTDINKLRKEIGMVFQHFNLYPHKRVIDNITLAPIKVLGINQSGSREDRDVLSGEGRYRR
jgi:ABC-type polar amino acid transport system ATPase subunit